MNNISDKLKEDCCGCSLCAQICPKRALTMTPDVEGFIYPKLNKELCVNCGLCVNICSFKEQDKSTSSHFYIARSLDSNILLNSASGGVFSHISNLVLEKGGVIYGAKYTNDFESVVHDRAINEDERNAFRDSKYLQSTIENVFLSITKDLQDEKYVLFSGTPCQCAAIKSFLSYKKIDDTRLFFVDIICHGVGSPQIWKQYLDFMKSVYKIKSIDSIVTRNKKIGDGYNLTFYSGNKMYYKKDKADPYINLFSRNLIERPSCFNCPFKSLNRCTDITIGDFQKANEYFPQYVDGRGVSVIIINTYKGINLFEKIKNKIVFEESDKKRSSQINLFQRKTNHIYRDAFFIFYLHNTFIDVLKKYTEIGLKNRFLGNTKRFIKDILSL